VSKRLPTTPVTYVLNVFDHILQRPVPNSEIYGTYYEEELVAFVLTPPPAHRATFEQQQTQAPTIPEGVKEEVQIFSAAKALQLLKAAGEQQEASLGLTKRKPVLELPPLPKERRTPSEPAVPFVRERIVTRSAARRQA